MNKTYVFFGIGSEYVLSPLALYMRDKGFSCLEIDLYKSPLDWLHLSDLKNKPTVFITSGHLFYDDTNYKIHHKASWTIYSPLEIMSYLNPLKSYIMPHDMTDLLHIYDFPWIDLFDAILAPTKDLNFLSSTLKVVPVGWINYNPNITTHFLENFPASKKIVALPSEITYYQHVGVEKFYKQWGHFIKAKIPFKFPNLSGVKELEHLVTQQKGNVLSRDISAFSLIDEADIILTNSNSSINIEAALRGKTVLNLLDDIFTHEKLFSYFADYPMIRLLHPIQAVNYIEAILQEKTALTPYPNTTTPFDYEMALATITQSLD